MTTQEILKNVEEATLVRPGITVYETEKEFFVEAEMPGALKEKIEVRVEEDHLILNASREWAVPPQAKVLHQETFPLEYYRDLSLGKDINTEGIQAVYENGILKVRLQKSEKVVPKKIQVL